MPAVVWDLADGAASRSLGAEENPAWEIEVSPDGDLVATIGMDEPPRVHVWDRRSGDLAFTVEDDGFYFERLAWRPDGEVFAVAGFHDGEGPGKTMIVNRTGQPVTELVEDVDHAPREVVFSPDGDQLITQRRTLQRDDPEIDGVRVWDWAEGEVVTDIGVFAEVVAVNPTGTKIVTGDVGRGGSIWDLATGDRLARLTGHNGDVFDVAFSPDGDTVATAGTDGTARLWNTESGTERLVLHSDEGPVSSVAFSPDGDQLATTSIGVTRVWVLDLDDLIGIAERRLTRSLTDDECRQYLHVEACPE